jgi:hypothetical protein
VGTTVRPAGARQQRRAQLAFEHPHLLRHGGGAQVQPPRGLGHRTAVGHEHEGVQVGGVHVMVFLACDRRSGHFIFVPGLPTLAA